MIASMLRPDPRIATWLKLANLALLVLYPIAWFAPLMRAGLLPLFSLDEISVITGLQSLWASDVFLALAVTAPVQAADTDVDGWEVLSRIEISEYVSNDRYRVFKVPLTTLTRRVDRHYKDGAAGWFDEVELTSIPSEAVRGQAIAEYLVDAVDIAAAHDLEAISDISLQPDPRRPTQAVSTAVAQPARVGQQRPLDNLRAAERWWFG